MIPTRINGSQIEPLAHLIPEIKELMKDCEWPFLKELLQDLSPVDVAESWHQFNGEERLQLFRLMDKTVALILFESLSLDDQTDLIKGLEDSKVASVLENIPSKDVAEIFQNIPARMVRKMVSLVKKEDAVKKIKLLMTFEPDTAGALLYPEFIKLTARMTCRQALALIQSVTRANRRKHLRSLYITDSSGLLLGAVALEELITAPADSTLADLMTSVEPFKLTPNLDQERVANIFSKYNLESAPVIDEKNHLLGSVIIDDIVDVISEEASEDIAKMAGTTLDEMTERSVLRIAWFRSPWLLATLVGQFMVFWVIRYFEYALNEIIALASFLPLIAAMGGNAGAQSAMICVRNMALGRLKGKARMLTVVRELRTGILLGLGYGLLVGAIALVLYSSTLGIEFAFVVGLSVMLAMAMAAFTGALGPIVLERMGIDPATAVGPMVTTTTDLLGITVYFLLAASILIRSVS